MTINVNKKSFNFREKLTELERPIGLKGSELMKSETAQEAAASIGVRNKNLCINGNFKCWQRGTSTPAGNAFPANGSNGYKYVTADRWQTYFPNNYSRQDSILPTGEKVYSLRETVGGTRNFLAYIIEGAGRLLHEGDEITISFWAKTSGDPTGLSLGFYWHDSWAGSAYSFTGYRSNVIIQDDNWRYYTVTTKLPENTTNRTHLAIEFDNNTAYGSWSQLANAGEYWEFANVQIEKGPVATEFEYRTDAEELLLCQRYYYEFPKGNTYNIIANGFVNQTTNAIFHFQYPVPMRIAPTVSAYGNWHVIDGTSHSITAFSSITDATTVTGRVDATTTGLTVGRGCMLRNNNDVDARFSFNAELDG